MKLTKSKLKQIIKEELTNILREGGTMGYRPSTYEAGGSTREGGHGLSRDTCGYDKQGNRKKAGRYNADGTICSPKERSAGTDADDKCVRRCMKTSAGGSFRGGNRRELYRHCLDKVCEEPEHRKPVTQRGFTQKAGAKGKSERRLPKGATSAACSKRGELMQNNRGESFECKRGKGGKLVWLKLQGSQHDWGTAVMQEQLNGDAGDQYANLIDRLQDMYEAWQPQTDEGMQYKDDLGDLLNQ